MTKVFTDQTNIIAGFFWNSDAKALDNLYGKKIYHSNGFLIPTQRFTQKWSKITIDNQKLFIDIQEKYVQISNPRGS